MSFANPSDISSDNFSPEEGTRLTRTGHWFWERLVGPWSPRLGWLIFLLTVSLAGLPIQAARSNEWIVLGHYASTLSIIGPLGVFFMWAMMGWHRNGSWILAWLRLQWEQGGARRYGASIAVALLVATVGLLLITNALVRWIPGPIAMIQATASGSWPLLLSESTTNLLSVFNRLARWAGGVSAGGATQDNLVFALFAGTIAWLNGLLTGYLVRRNYSGLLSALPSLWLLMAALLYGTAGRGIFIVGLLVALLLQLFMDHRGLTAVWDRNRISYSDGLILDRAVAAAGIAVVVLGAAALIPNLRLSFLADRYQRLYEPFNSQVEDLGQRFFPDMKATSRFQGSALSDGLPNSFLLGAGPELREIEVMRVRTDEIMVFEPDIVEETPRLGHYMRGGTLSDYDGLGWRNPIVIDRIETEADQFVPNLLISEQLAVDGGSAELPRGRRLLTQDVFLSFNSRGLYGAAEPLSFSIDYRLDRRGVGDSTAFWVGRGANGITTGASSYTVLSAVPDANEASLLLEPSWVPDEEDALWNELQRHLLLPDTITDRTKALSEELTANLESPYAKASAIEQYLRGYEYDLEVSQPPDDITDVADYFLFDLQRGYCDYYTTSFIVLARLAGLPARFASGFVPGRWNSGEGVWIVTEAEAHSWPEVYFPSYGWIPFEPTAGRPELSRFGVGPEVAPASMPAMPSIEPVALPSADGETWNWQMLFWLLPLGLLAWGLAGGLRWWLYKRQDPWMVILRWGTRIGHPIKAGETLLEYGTSLGDFVRERYQEKNQDAGRAVSRELTTLTQQLTAANYGTSTQRTEAVQQVEEQWRVLHGYVSRLK